VRFTNGATPTLETDPLSAILSTTMPNTADLLNPNSETNVKVTDVNGKLDWSAVSYVIGGFGWKARWGVKDTVDNTATGYIWSSSVSSPSGAQFNMLAADTTLDPKGHRGDWSTYGSATKKYSCAICHNTNGTSSTDALCNTPLGSGRTEPWASTGLTTTAPGGFRSEWTYSGVQCEACHGPAANHVKSPSANTLGVLRVTHGANDYEICAKCHIRTNNNALGYGDECGGDSNEAILTGGSSTNATTGFEGHHQQFNQVFGYNGDGAHASIECTACHNPHKRAATVTSGIASALSITDNNQTAVARGAVVSCESCHAPENTGADTKIAATAHPSTVGCIDCHMASSTQSATSEKATGTTSGIAAWGKSGDVAGHIFSIDPTSTTMSRTNAAGKTIAANSITVNYACGKCHDPYMNDFVGTAFTREQASVLATNIHNLTPKTASFTWALGASNGVVDFTVTSGCANAPCVNTFNYGDGTSGTALSHTYATAGNYLATLTVTDALSNVSMSPIVGVSAVSTNIPPTASKSAPVVTGMTVSVTDTSTDAQDAQGALAVTVNCGNGTIATGAGGSTLVCTYTSTGTYTIRHSVKDTGGKGSLSAPVSVNVNATKYRVSGTITKQDGTPIPYATLKLKLGGVIKYSGTSSSTGTFAFGAVLPGSYTVTATKTGLTFADPAATVDVVAAPVAGVVVKSNE
jgi:PKD repeat protein